MGSSPRGCSTTALPCLLLPLLLLLLAAAPLTAPLRAGGHLLGPDAHPQPACPRGTITLSTTRLHCLCPAGQMCVGPLCRRTTLEGQPVAAPSPGAGPQVDHHRYTFSAGCRSCFCTDKPMCRLELEASTLPDCQSSPLWPACTASPWGWDLQPRAAPGPQGQPGQQQGAGRKRCLGDINSAAGHWVLPCKFSASRLRHLSHLPAGSHWELDACDLDYFAPVSLHAAPTRNITACLRSRVLAFLGDSTLRGILERLVDACGGDLAPFSSSGDGRHNSAHIALPLCSSDAFYQYYPVLRDTRAPRHNWTHAAAVFEAERDRELAHYLHSQCLEMQALFGGIAFDATPLHFAFGGLWMRADWARVVQRYAEHPGSLLARKLALGTVSFVFKSNHLRGNTAPRRQWTMSEAARDAILPLRPAGVYKWLEVTSMSFPFWPRMAIPDHCICHFHSLHVRPSPLPLPDGSVSRYSVHGPVNDEMANLFLNAVCGAAAAA